jgi:catalase
LNDARAQSGDYLTTAQGLRLPDTDHSLKAGERGPTLLEDFHLREKITHFDHERIPERVVHARGAAAHGRARRHSRAVLANVDADLCEQVAAGLGLPAPEGQPVTDVMPSPALTQIVAEPGPITGRSIGVIADAGSDLAGIDQLRRAAKRHGATVHVIAPVGGELSDGTSTEIVERTLLTTRSVEFDALVVADGTTPVTDIKLVLLLQEAYRHCKTLAAWGTGSDILSACAIPLDAPGVMTRKSVKKAFNDQLFAAMGLHRALGSGGPRHGLRRPTGHLRAPSSLTADARSGSLHE